MANGYYVLVLCVLDCIYGAPMEFNGTSISDISLGQSNSSSEADWSAERDIPIEHLIIFGDSLSDDGISHEEQFGFRRYSSGNVWGEYVAEQLGLDLFNMAYGGAKSGHGNFHFDGWSGLLWQVARGINITKSADEDLGLPAFESTLFGIQTCGLNDIYQDVTSDPSQIANNNLRAIQALLDAGAKNLFVLNLPDPKMIPDLIDRGADAVFDASVTFANEAIQKGIEHMKLSRGTRVALIDFYAIMGDLKEKFILKPFVRSEDTMFGDQRKYAFTQDGIHPTDQAHRFLAESITHLVEMTLFTTK